MCSGRRSHQYLDGARALFEPYRFGPGELAGFGGESGRVGVHGEIAGGQAVEHEAALVVGFGVATAIAGFQFDDGGDGRADAAGIVGEVEIALEEQVAGDEALNAAGVIGIILVEVEVGEIVAGIGRGGGCGCRRRWS